MTWPPAPPWGETAYRAGAAEGRALLKSAPYHPAHEEPDTEFPFRFTTGRTAYHFHTRTKTARSRRLNDAAPAVWAELGAEDAAQLGAAEGDLLEITSRRGRIVAPVRICQVRTGTVFVPFHYGYWDSGGAPGAEPTAANELTLTDWDPVSKQPVFKNAAVRISRLPSGTASSPAPEATAPSRTSPPEEP